MIAAYGGRHISRGGRAITFERPEGTRRVVIAEFPDFAKVETCYCSPEFRR